MARGDGKNKFYRKLNVSKEVKQVIKFYNRIKQQMQGDRVLTKSEIKCLKS